MRSAFAVKVTNLATFTSVNSHPEGNVIFYGYSDPTHPLAWQPANTNPLKHEPQTPPLSPLGPAHRLPQPPPPVSLRVVLLAAMSHPCRKDGKIIPDPTPLVLAHARTHRDGHLPSVCHLVCWHLPPGVTEGETAICRRLGSARLVGNKQPRCITLLFSVSPGRVKCR